MKKLLLATLAVAASSGVLAAPAQAASDDHWTAEDTTACAADLTVTPVVEAVSPLPAAEKAPTCGEGSLLHHG